MPSACSNSERAGIQSLFLTFLQAIDFKALALQFKSREIAASY
jgi:hypothetical protein